MVASTPIRLLFLLQRPESWINLASVWRLATDDPQFAPEVWAVPPGTCATEDSLHIERIRMILSTDNVPFQLWTKELQLEKGMFDAVIFSAPYDRERPSQLFFDIVARKIPCTIYIPYGIVVGGGRKNQLFQYAQPTQAHATAVIARSSFEKALYRHYCPSGDRHVHVLGLPRMDSLTQLDLFQVDPELTSAIGGRFPILWNSHFSFTAEFVGSAQFSTFDAIGPELFDYAVSHPEIALIWRPHPGLLPAVMRAGLLSSNQLGAFMEEIKRAGIIFDDRPDHRHVFATSRALLTDLGSFLVEFLATGNPILYLDNPAGEGLNEEGQVLVQHCETAQSPEEVIAFIERVRRNIDLCKTARIAARARFLPRFDGNAGARVLALITSTVTRHRGTGSLETPVKIAYPLLHQFQQDLIAIRQRKASVPKWKRVVSSRWIAVRRWLSHEFRKHPNMLRIHKSIFARKS